MGGENRSMLPHALTAIRLLYAAVWTALLFLGPPPPHLEPAAQAFWSAIEATGFMVPLLGACYFVGGLLLWMRRTAPLGLALMHGTLHWVCRRAFAPLWSYGE